MKKISFFKIIFWLLLFPFILNAQIHITGKTTSMLYNWEGETEKNQMDFYQYLNLGISSETMPGTKVNLNFREAYFKQSKDFGDRLYNFYVTSSIKNMLKFKIGRQFIYAGVLNGSLDGAMIDFSPSKSVNFGVVAGSTLPENGTFKLEKWNKGNIMGAFSRIHFKENTFFLSYMNRSHNEKTALELAGVNWLFKPGKNWNTSMTLNYNLQSSEIQKLRVLAQYLVSNGIFSLEYAIQKPIIYEYSFFKIFEIKPYNQIRSSFYKRFKPMDMSIAYQYTVVEEEADNEWTLSLGKRMNSIGFIYSSGMGGDNLGVFGRVKYNVIKSLFLTAYASYYNYQRYMIDISEHALAYSAGITYQNGLSTIRMELQQMSNNLFKNDLRGLVQYSYRFNF